MLIEINYQLPTGNPNGYIVAQRLLRDDDIVSVDPKPDDATRSVMRVKGGGGSQFAQMFTDLTLVESYMSFKDRYGNVPSDSRIVAAPAPVQPPSSDCGGC